VAPVLTLDHAYVGFRDSSSSLSCTPGQANISDEDSGPLNPPEIYFWWDGEALTTLYVDANGNFSSVADEGTVGFFTIDPETGAITATAELQHDGKDYILPLVAWDGVDRSNVVEVTVVKFHELSSLGQLGEDTPNLMLDGVEHYRNLDSSWDVLELDTVGPTLSQLGVFYNANGLNFRFGDGRELQVVQQEKFETQIDGEDQVDVFAGWSNWVEYVRFGPAAELVFNPQHDEEGEDYSVPLTYSLYRATDECFPDNGVYQVVRADLYEADESSDNYGRWVVDASRLGPVGLASNDLLVGSDAEEVLAAEEGDDLIFAFSRREEHDYLRMFDHDEGDDCEEIEGEKYHDYGRQYEHTHADGCLIQWIGGDIVDGGAGDDLIVLQGGGHRVRFSEPTANGFDTVIGFFTQEGYDDDLDFGNQIDLDDFGLGLAFLDSCDLGEDGWNGKIVELDDCLSDQFIAWLATTAQEGSGDFSAFNGYLSAEPGSSFYVIGYQDGHAYLYHINDAAGSAGIQSSEVSRMAVFADVEAGAFKSADFYFPAPVETFPV